jgi:hypothetical protein
MITPLTILSIFFGISFLDGMFAWGLADGFYIIAGLAMIGSVIWMWMIELRK